MIQFSGDETIREFAPPLAMAEAFRSGNLGIMDYYRMKNLAADTDMRSKIAGADDSTSDQTKPK